MHLIKQCKWHAYLLNPRAVHMSDGINRLDLKQLEGRKDLQFLLRIRNLFIQNRRIQKEWPGYLPGRGIIMIEESSEVYI